MIRFIKAHTIDAEIIHLLAHRIYYPTYTDILSVEQMDFMLEKSYSVEALKNTISVEQDFYIVYDEHTPIGFIAFKQKTREVLRIEKLYLLPSLQGKGVGKLCIDFAYKIANSLACSKLELNVNRGNKAYHFYLKMGFEVTEIVDIPYFGYILDDYVMQKQVV